jgi:hypothetical protein
VARGRRAAPSSAGGRAIGLGDQLLGAKLLAGRRVLVVEDEFLIADEMAVAFARLGIQTVGPARMLEHALKLLKDSGHLDGAVLDVNKRGTMVYSLVDALFARGVPFIFATGYDSEVILKRYRHIPRCEDPLNYMNVIRALFTT